MRLARVSTRRVVALIVAVSGVTCSTNAYTFEWKDLWQRKDQQARALLQSGNAELAAEVFTDPRWRGISQHQAGNYKQAIDEFNVNDDAQSVYNRGVAQVMEGEYEAAVGSFESVLEEQPDNNDAAHNLEIAKALLEQQQQQQQDQSGESDQEQNEGDSSSQKDQSNSSGDENTDAQESESTQQESQSSQEQSGEQSSSDNQAEQQSSPGDEQSAEDNEEQGELSEDAQKTGESNGSELDEKAEEALRQAMNAQAQAENSDEPEQQQQGAAAVEAGQNLSEENQATEQWLRRIPDDPSQLLRNKIKLNHMIEHPNVGDTAQPW